MKADEGFYAAFSPRRLKQELAEVEDLVLPASASLQGLDVGAAFRLAAALLMLAAVIPGYIVPQVRLVLLQDLATACQSTLSDVGMQSQILAEAGDALCGEATLCA